MQAMPRTRSASTGSTGTTAGARLLAALGLTALLGGMAVIMVGSGGAGGGKTTGTAAETPQTTTTARPAVRPPGTVKVTVRGIGAYDPQGDHVENDGQASLATDGDPATAWRSEHYITTFSKSGIGLVLDAGRPVRATRLVLTTDTPGYDAQIQAGDSRGGPFTAISVSQTTSTRTAFALRTRSARYLLVWITSMPAGGVAAVNEVAVAARS
jgi:putative peptidoglycan lipid II flippase